MRCTPVMSQVQFQPSRSPEDPSRNHKPINHWAPLLVDYLLVMTNIDMDDQHAIHGKSQYIIRYKWPFISMAIFSMAMLNYQRVHGFILKLDTPQGIRWYTLVPFSIAILEVASLWGAPELWGSCLSFLIHRITVPLCLYITVQSIIIMLYQNSHHCIFSRYSYINISVHFGNLNCRFLPWTKPL